MTAAKIAAVLHLARSTVARLLQREGIGRLRLLEPEPEPRSYEWPRPGDMRGECRRITSRLNSEEPRW